MPPAGALWVVCPRPHETAGRGAGPGSPHPPRFHSPAGTPLTRQPGSTLAGAPTGLPDVGSPRSGRFAGNLAVAANRRRIGRAACTFRPGLAVEPAGPSWGTCNRIVPTARSGDGLRPLVNRRRRLGQSRVRCDAHRGQQVAGVLSTGWARQPSGLWARGQRAASGAENWSRRRGCLHRRRWARVAGPVSSAPRLKPRSSSTASVRRWCRWPRWPCSRWSRAA